MRRKIALQADLIARMSTPQSHFELEGASGQRYRFRRVKDPSALPAEGGNFVYVRHTDEGPIVIGCGASECLHQAADLWKEAVERHGADSIFVRLNIARRQRLLEHEDISAVHSPPMQSSLP